MGNALQLKCPHCGDTAEKPVCHTDSDLRYVSSVEKDGISYRRRNRQCMACNRSFESVELHGDDFNKLVENSNLASHLIYRINGDLSDINDETTRSKAIAALRLIFAIFGERFPKSWEPIYPISEEEAALIILRVEQTLLTLELPERESVCAKFSINFENSNATSQRFDEELFNKAMRKLKHPSRSKNLRRLAEIPIGKRRQV